MYFQYPLYFVLILYNPESAKCESKVQMLEFQAERAPEGVVPGVHSEYNVRKYVVKWITTEYNGRKHAVKWPAYLTSSSKHVVKCMLLSMGSTIASYFTRFQEQQPNSN